MTQTNASCGGATQCPERTSLAIKFTCDANQQIVPDPSSNHHATGTAAEATPAGTMDVGTAASSFKGSMITAIQSSISATDWAFKVKDCNDDNDSMNSRNPGPV